jgi:hypothetical protein
MDMTSFAAFRRACQQLSDDNQATLDWTDDTDFRFHVKRVELKEPIERTGSQPAKVPDAAQTKRTRTRQR